MQQGTVSCGQLVYDGRETMIKQLKQIFLKNKTVKNAGWLISEKIVQALINFAVSILTTRFLGPANYGLINYGVAYTAFFMSLCTLGINSILVKEFTDKKYDEGTVLGTTILLRMLSSLLSIGVIFCIVYFVDADEPTTIIVTLLCSFSLFFNVFDSFTYWFQSRLQSRVTAIASAIAYMITAGYKVVLLILKKDVQWFAFATSVDYICIAAILFICYKKYSESKLKFSVPCAKHLLGKSYHFILTGLMVAIYGYVDKFMLKHMISETETGYYSTAVAVSTMWCFVLSAIISSVYPSITSSHKAGDMVVFEKRNKQLYAIVFYLSLIVSSVFAIFGKYAILIIYGETYLPAAAPLRIATWYVAFSYLGVARDAWIVCENKQKYLKYIYLSASIMNIILNSIFIPMWGASGAAFASLVTQIMTIAIAAVIKPLRPNAKLMLDAIMLKGVLPKREHKNRE